MSYLHVHECCRTPGFRSLGTISGVLLPETGSGVCTYPGENLPFQTRQTTPNTQQRQRPEPKGDSGRKKMLAHPWSPIGVMFRRRRSVPAWMIVSRLIVMRRRNNAAGQGKSHANQRDNNETTHDNSFFPLSRHDRLKVAVALRPPSGLFSSVTSPPCMRAMLRAMERPSPVPPVLRLRDRSTL